MNYTQNMSNLLISEGSEQTEMKLKGLGMATGGLDSERSSQDVRVCHPPHPGKIRDKKETSTHADVDDQELCFAVDIPQPDWQTALMATDVAEMSKPGRQTTLMTNVTVAAVGSGEVHDYQIQFETPKKVRFNEYVSCKQVY